MKGEGKGVEKKWEKRGEKKRGMMWEKVVGHEQLQMHPRFYATVENCPTLEVWGAKGRGREEGGKEKREEKRRRKEKKR